MEKQERTPGGYIYLESVTEETELGSKLKFWLFGETRKKRGDLIYDLYRSGKCFVVVGSNRRDSIRYKVSYIWLFWIVASSHGFLIVGVAVCLTDLSLANQRGMGCEERTGRRLDAVLE